MNRSAPLALLASVLACAPHAKPSTEPFYTAFDPQSVRWAEGSGTAALEGQIAVFYSGSVQALQVVVTPACAQSLEWVKATRGAYGATDHPAAVPAMDSRLRALQRAASISSNGLRFSISDLPAGDYYVMAQLRYEDEVRTSIVAAKVHLSSGETSTVRLSQ